MKLKDALKGIEVINDEAHEMFPPQDIIETPELRAIAIDIEVLNEIYDAHKNSGYSARKKLDMIKKALTSLKDHCGERLTALEDFEEVFEKHMLNESNIELFNDLNDHIDQVRIAPIIHKNFETGKLAGITHTKFEPGIKVDAELINNSIEFSILVNKQLTFNLIQTVDKIMVGVI